MAWLPRSSSDSMSEARGGGGAGERPKDSPPFLLLPQPGGSAWGRNQLRGSLDREAALSGLLALHPYPTLGETRPRKPLWLHSQVSQTDEGNHRLLDSAANPPGILQRAPWPKSRLRDQNSSSLSLLQLPPDKSSLPAPVHWRMWTTPKRPSPAYPSCHPRSRELAPSSSRNEEGVRCLTWLRL